MPINFSCPRIVRHSFVALGAAMLWLPAVSNAAASEPELRTLRGEVTAIALRGPVDLKLTQGETRGVQLEGEPAERAQVKLEVNNGELHITFEGSGLGGWSWWSKRTPLTATLAVPTLKHLQVTGSGDAALGAFDLKDGELKIDVTGSGDVRLDGLTAAALRTSIVGSGDVRVSGQVKSQALSIAGSGDYDGRRLKSQTAAISIRGSGDVDVDATETLAVDIAGSGDVRYRGQPKLAKTIRGSGEVTRKD